jgi:DNA-binding XRE family transcriptional regulator
MSEKNGTPAVKPTVDELRAEIKQTRAELGETVQALAAKADVKARAMDQVEQTKQRVRVAAAAAGEKVRAVAGQASEKVKENAPLDRAATRVRTGPVPVVVLFAGVVALVGVVLIVRGRCR